jgi:FMN phosphatase YigB (HAD superfamily)
VALKAVFLDVGETLVDEERWWRELARRLDVQPHVLWAALGVTIVNGEEHDAVWARLGLEKPAVDWNLLYDDTDLHSDAFPCLEGLRGLGLRVGIAGNQTPALEAWAREAGLPVDVVTSSASLGVRKPDPRFFDALAALAACDPGELAYVGDRVDNDVLPARAAGLAAVHVRRGPWGRLQPTPEGVPAVESLLELPDALASLP